MKPNYIFKVTINFKFKNYTDGSTKESVYTIIASNIIEACKKVNDKITPLSEDLKFSDIVRIERKDKIDN